MGNADKAIRIMVAFQLGLLFFSELLTGIVGNIAIAFAILLFVTAVIGNCPLYSLIGLNTCGKSDPDNH